MLAIQVIVEASTLDWLTLGISSTTLVLFALILWFTRKSADAAVKANQRAQEEMDIRLSPFISITGVDSIAIVDHEGRVFRRKDPVSGILSMDAPAETGWFVRYEVFIRNSGPMAAMQTGFGHGKGFDRKIAHDQMREASGHFGSLIPPETTTTTNFEIPIAEVRRFRESANDPYYLAFSVAYKDRNSNGKIVEMEGEFRSSSFEVLRHSAPEPFTEPTDGAGDT